MGQAEIVVVGLLVAVAGLSALARRLSLPYPIVLVLGGALLGFVPALPQVRLDPEVVLLVFLPPLLYGSSIFANFNDFRGDLRWLALNTVGLCWRRWGRWPGWRTRSSQACPGRPPSSWGRSSRRLTRWQRRLVSAVEGEGLCNDATALVAYRVAVAAVVAGSFSVAEAGLRFVLGAAGGVAIGLVVGWVVAEIRQRTTDTQVSVTISLLTGYAAFVPADAVGASGVLAAVTAGIYMGIRGPRILPVGARLQGAFVWDIVDFLVNAILFLLIGLQLRAVVAGLSGYSARTLGGYALAVTAVVVCHPGARAVRHAAATGHNPRDNLQTATNPDARWLFPGRRAGQPLHASHLSELVRDLGVPALAGRAAALCQLVLQVPAPVVAQALGYHHNTTTRVATEAGTPWSRYAASRARTDTTQRSQDLR